MSKTKAEIQKVSCKYILHIAAPKIRRKYDTNVTDDISSLCSYGDAAIADIRTAGAELSKLQGDKKMQRGHVLALLQKCINDVLGSCEILRAGYFDLAQGIMRSAFEAFATAVLVDSDSNSYLQFKENRLSVNGSPARLLSRRNLGISKAQAKKFHESYKKLHLTAHPTIAAIALHFHYERKQYPFGGSYDEGKLKLYKAHLCNLMTLARNISGFVHAKLL